jgi:hypothetical protein
VAPLVFQDRLPLAGELICRATTALVADLAARLTMATRPGARSVRRSTNWVEKWGTRTPVSAEVDEPG